MGWLLGSVVLGSLGALLTRVIRYGVDLLLGLSWRGLMKVLRSIAINLLFLLVVYSVTASIVLFLFGMAASQLFECSFIDWIDTVSQGGSLRQWIVIAFSSYAICILGGLPEVRDNFPILSSMSGLASLESREEPREWSRKLHFTLSMRTLLEDHWDIWQREIEQDINDCKRASGQDRLQLLKNLEKLEESKFRLGFRAPARDAIRACRKAIDDGRLDIDMSAEWSKLFEEIFRDRPRCIRVWLRDLPAPTPRRRK